MPKPILGIMACNRPVGNENAHAVMERYTRAVSYLGDVQPLIIPPIADQVDFEAILSVVDGVLLTGSPSNISPHHYGDLDEGDGPFDRERDQVSFSLARLTIAAQKPLFAICRGFQELNVLSGGTLRRDVGFGKHQEAGLHHHAHPDASYDEMFCHAHSVTIHQGGLLSKVYGAGDMRVNSVHFQGVDQLGSGLRIEAVAPDGLIEAFSVMAAKAPALAVQWHPEYTAFDEAQSVIYFDYLKDTLKQAAA